MIRSIEHLSEDLASQTATATQRAETEATEAPGPRHGWCWLPFEHTGRLASLRERLAEINETLNPVEDDPGAIALEPEEPTTEDSETAATTRTHCSLTPTGWPTRCVW